MGDAPSPPLATIDHAFHAQYDAARLPAYAPPVLVVTGEELVVFRDGERATFTFVPSGSRFLKAAAHAPVGLFVTLMRLGTSSDAERQAKLGPWRGWLSDALGTLDDAPLGAEARADVRHVLETSAAFVARSLAARPDDPTRDAFAAGLAPALLALTRHATALQIDALDGLVASVLEGFTSSERDSFVVVVTGDHQARARNLGMQYFKKLLGEHSEDRVSYAESVQTADEAFALVGTRLLDETIATAFFGDRRRLQQDVLGDAVTQLLEGRTLPGAR